MSTDDPPNNYFNGIGYNPLFYVKDTVGITKAAGDTYYLSKQNSDISTAPLTTFNGAVNTYGDLTVGQRGISGGIFNIYRRMRIWDINNASATYGDIYSTGTDMEYTVFNQGSAIQTYHKFNTCPSSSSTASLKFEVGNTTTKIFNSLETGIQGDFTTSVNMKTGLIVTDTNSPYLNNLQIFPQGSFSNYTMYSNLNINTSHNFKTYDTTNSLSTPLSISSASVDVNTRLTHGSTSYSFPFLNSQNQGY